MPEFVNVTTAQLETSRKSMIWFHDLFRADGTPYDPAEIELFKKYTDRTKPISSSASTQRLS